MPHPTPPYLACGEDGAPMRCPRASSEAELMSEAGSGVHVPSTGRPFHSVFETKFTFFTGFYKMKPRSCKILRAARRGGGAARGAGVRPPSEITRRNFFSTAPLRMFSASEKRPAPIARQRACGAQRRKSQYYPHSTPPHVPNKVFF